MPLYQQNRETIYSENEFPSSLISLMAMEAFKNLI